MAWPKQPEQLLSFLVNHLNAELDLLGDGPREEEVKDLANELGVQSRVVFHGHVSDINPILARGDLFALVSRLGRISHVHIGGDGGLLTDGSFPCWWCP